MRRNQIRNDDIITIPYTMKMIGILSFILVIFQAYALGDFSDGFTAYEAGSFFGRFLAVWAIGVGIAIATMLFTGRDSEGPFIMATIAVSGFILLSSIGRTIS